jgi:hypothetical protein
MPDLPLGYARASAELEPSLQTREAWSSYEIDGDEQTVLVHWRTNDDFDHGVPTAYADDTYTVQARDGKTAIERALEFAGGGSRHGVGQACFVRVNGVLVEKVGIEPMHPHDVGDYSDVQ